MKNVDPVNVRRTGKSVRTNMEGKTWGVIGMSTCGEYLFINHKTSPKAEPEVKMIKRSDYMMRDRLYSLIVFSDKIDDHKLDQARHMRGLWVLLYETIQDQIVSIDIIPDICRPHLSMFQTQRWLLRDGDKYKITPNGIKMYRKIIDNGKSYSL